MKFVGVFLISLALIAYVQASGGSGHGNNNDDDDDDVYKTNDYWCKASRVFNKRNQFQVESAGIWNQSIAYHIPFNPAAPNQFLYAGSAQYFQINSYDRSQCRFVSVQIWPSCVNPFSPAVFPEGLYFQSVAQKIVIDRQNPTAFQKYDVDYITPAVPIVPAQNTNKWVSIGVGPAIANTVFRVDENGDVTDEVVYAESIVVLPADNPSSLRRRVYVPATLSATEITAIAPFDSREIPALPAPFNTMTARYLSGNLALSYLQSCDGGLTWIVAASSSACNQCSSSDATALCAPTYYLPFTTSNPCST